MNHKHARVTRVKFSKSNNLENYLPSFVCEAVGDLGPSSREAGGSEKGLGRGLHRPSPLKIIPFIIAQPEHTKQVSSREIKQINM